MGRWIGGLGTGGASVLEVGREHFAACRTGSDGCRAFSGFFWRWRPAQHLNVNATPSTSKRASPNLLYAVHSKSTIDQIFFQNMGLKSFFITTCQQ